MSFAEPETWSSGVYFCLGALVGIMIGLTTVGILEIRGIVAVAISVGVALLCAIVGALLREHLVELWIRWN
jgi:hypothetical protein